MKRIDRLTGPSSGRRLPIAFAAYQATRFACAFMAFLLYVIPRFVTMGADHGTGSPGTSMLIIAGTSMTRTGAARSSADGRSPPRTGTATGGAACPCRGR